MRTVKKKKKGVWGGAGNKGHLGFPIVLFQLKLYHTIVFLKSIRHRCGHGKK